jgi:hypothetical protein
MCIPIIPTSHLAFRNDAMMYSHTTRLNEMLFLATFVIAPTSTDQLSSSVSHSLRILRIPTTDRQRSIEEEVESSTYLAHVSQEIRVCRISTKIDDGSIRVNSENCSSSSRDRHFRRIR